MTIPSSGVRATALWKSHRNLTADRPRKDNLRLDLNPQARLERIAKVLVKAMYLYASDCERHCHTGQGNEREHTQMPQRGGRGMISFYTISPIFAMSTGHDHIGTGDCGGLDTKNFGVFNWNCAPARAIIIRIGESRLGARQRPHRGPPGIEHTLPPRTPAPTHGRLQRST